MKQMTITQTPYIDHEGRNRVWIDAQDWSGELQLQAGEWKQTLTVQANVLCETRVPCPQQQTLLELRWQQDGSWRRQQAVLLPVKKWKVGFILSSHEDLGYEDYANQLDNGCATLAEIAMDYMERWPDYRYFIEHFRWLKAVETYGGAAETERLKRFIAKGQMDVGFPHSGVHTHWHGAEQLARSTYYGGREAQTFGIAPQTAIFADISGMAWSAVGAYAQAGVRYVLNPHNRFRDHDEGYPITPLFWWEAPNGKDRVLFWTEEHYRNRMFSVGDHLFYPKQYHVAFPQKDGMDPEEKLADCHRYLQQADLLDLEKSITDYMNHLADEAWDVLPVSFYMDRELPLVMPKAFCDEMAERWAWPRFELRTPTDCMQELEQRFGDQLPVFRGELNDQWSDAAAASPVSVSLKRQAERLFPVAEMLQTFGAASVPNELPEAMDRMCAFDEHCWATGIPSPVEMHRFNQQYVKEYGARVAHQLVEQTLEKNMAGEKTDGVSILNPLPRPVRTSVRMDGALQLEGVEQQILYDGGTLTAPIELPSLGVRPFPTGKPLESSQSFAECEAGCIRTPLYELRYDAATGRVTSLKLRQNGTELLDANSRYALGEYIFVQSPDKTSPRVECNLPETRGVTVDSGSLAVTLLRDSYEPESEARIRTAITLYRDQPQIDVEVRFERARSLLGNVADRYRKNVFLALPLSIPHFRFFTETPLAAVEEGKERLPLRAQDFVVAKDGVWVEDEQTRRGVLVCSRDMPLFHLGGIHYQQFNAVMPLESSGLFLYAASNRCAQLSTHSEEDCQGRYRLSLLPYENGWQQTLPQLECMTLAPVVLEGYGQEQSWLEMCAETPVHWCCFKRAEDGEAYVLRVREMAGKTPHVTVRLPFEAVSACYADIVEEPLGQPAEVSGANVSFTAQANAYTTLRITPVQMLPRAEEKLEKQPVLRTHTYEAHEGDQVLIWEKSSLEAAQAYRIFCDGQFLMEVPNEPFMTQFVRTGVCGRHSFAVEAISEAE